MVDEFKEIEKEMLKFWDKNKIYKFDTKRKGKIFSIDTPPPTVSGTMHIGHACSYSQQDFIARYRRMKENVFYPFGTDDNGLPTERLVERLKKVKSKDMTRKEFIDLCLKTLKEIIPEFVQDWKNLGISADFNISYSTIDENSRKISQKSFIELYDKGLVYKKEFPTIWCPECQTPIAQAELEDKTGETLFSILKFSVGKEDLLIATTRPELIGACVAVFVNPKDKRYKNFVGKKARVPLFNYEVPILEDESADMEKGTGVLMICSYGDKFDVDAIMRHKLNPRLVLSKDGKLNIDKYKGMKIKEARKKILEDLQRNGLIKEEKKISHVVNVHDKCGTEIEFVMTEQWFIKILENRKKLIEQGKKIKWHPEFMYKRYENWVNGLDWDWSISRERHFGVPIPVWYCSKCNTIVLPKENELPVDPIAEKRKCDKCNNFLKGDERVLDTWATSSLTPQIANSLVKEIKLPYSLRPQAHDIIRTWAFYTIVKSLYHENKLPWENIMVSGFITLGGEKMSKSKGNVIKPQEVMEKYGSDALRFWAAGSKLGEDLNYEEKDLVTGKKFITKLINASKFVFMNLNDYKQQKPKKLEKTDELFLDKLNQLIIKCTESFENYEYSKAKMDIERFFFSIFTDNYLEIVKKRVYNDKGDKKLSAQYTLYNGLLTILKLTAPIMPFVTEYIYQEHYRKNESVKSIHLSIWPESEPTKDKENDLDFFIEILTKVRQEKSNNKKPMNSEIILTITKESKKRLLEMIQDLTNVTNAREIKEGNFEVKFL